MSASARHRQLGSSLAKLRKALLPRKFDPTGSYRNTQSVHVKAVSFRLLVHAEIESYLEDKALELATAGWNVWKAKRISTDVSVGLLAFAGFEMFKPPKKLGGDGSNQKAYEDCGSALERSHGTWRYDHKNNHGVKEENVLALYLPLGLPIAALDSTLLADLSSYGASRGQVAHASSLSVATFADPKTEFEKAKNLIDDLMKLDTSVALALDRIQRVLSVL